MNYLTHLKNNLHLDPSVESDIILEINTHIEDRRQELIDKGLSEEDADNLAVKLFGSPQLIAKQLYEVYSQGTWKQALCAALPHLLVASFFALHLLPNIFSMVSLSLISVATVIYGYCRGKPTWLFPWLGYLLIPAIVIGIMLINLSNEWTWIAGLLYIPLAVTILLLIYKQTIRRDWLFTSLMLLPIPICLGWIVVFSTVFSLDGTLFLLDDAHLYQTASWIALSFAILALTVVIFIRVKQRWAKAGVLILPEVSILIMVAISYNGITLWTTMMLMLLAFTLIFGPAFIEYRLKKKLRMRRELRSEVTRV